MLVIGSSGTVNRLCGAMRPHTGRARWRRAVAVALRFDRMRDVRRVRLLSQHKLLDLLPHICACFQYQPVNILLLVIEHQRIVEHEHHGMQEGLAVGNVLDSTPASVSGSQRSPGNTGCSAHKRTPSSSRRLIVCKSIGHFTISS